MGMVMLPPVFISLPFKILLFVLVDGWNLVTRRSWRASTHDTRTPSSALAVAGDGARAEGRRCRSCSPASSSACSSRSSRPSRRSRSRRSRSSRRSSAMAVRRGHRRPVDARPAASRRRSSSTAASRGMVGRMNASAAAGAASASSRSRASCSCSRASRRCSCSRRCSRSKSIPPRARTIVAVGDRVRHGADRLRAGARTRSRSTSTASAA